ncbi:MAG: glycosyltransferase family 2 protein, partial [Actinobacteria bacterium]|nr:glycosyltransferase family 2 protein [Actinomycetota bacterium]
MSHSPTHPDLTAVVTAHKEGRLLRPTLRSVAGALTRLVEAGHSAELLIMCDSADETVLREARRWCALSNLSFAVRMNEVMFGESGASRNAGAVAAQGAFLAFVDGDDLVSSSYFVAALQILRATSSPVILHPEYVVSFGARSLLWRTESTRIHGVSYRDLIRHNLWPSSAVTRRDVYLEHP